MAYKIYIPRDSSALSLGANDVYKEILKESKERKLDISIIRNGSRGIFWLEPMIEVETSNGRVAYGPISVTDIPSLFDQEFYLGKKHSLFLGITEEISWLKKQERLTYARVGIIDPVDIDDYERHDGFKGLKKSISLSQEDIVKEVTDSGLRGRGGAAFPTGIKWKSVMDNP